jgi:RNA polymerase sigma factor (sigma-70 family)
MTDANLLHRYARDRDQAAFAELVRRHADLVYSAARRQLDGDHHRAQEVTQIVFLGLARKAASLARHPCLAGWLYQTTRYTAARHRQSDTRRSARETLAATDPALPVHAPVSATTSAASPEPPADWSRVEPLLDDALATLGEADRQAVLLRYFTGHAYAEIGRQLGLAENTARMRTERALEKLRQALAVRAAISATHASHPGLARRSSIRIPSLAAIRIRTLDTVLGARPSALAIPSTVSPRSRRRPMSCSRRVSRDPPDPLAATTKPRTTSATRALKTGSPLATRSTASSNEVSGSPRSTMPNTPARNITSTVSASTCPV